MAFSDIKSAVGNRVGGIIHNALFMEAFRNLNWSRGYDWYVELDDVPHPFQRGGVIGLPVTDMSLDISQGKSYSWDAALDSFSVPLRRGSVASINLTMMDDEQGTLLTFFQRWYNMIYNSEKGVLPVLEASKVITVYRTKSTRTNITTVYKNDYADANKESGKQESQGRDFLVYPTQSINDRFTIDSNPNVINVHLEVVEEMNRDYANPNAQPGSIDPNLGKLGAFLDRISDYI